MKTIFKVNDPVFDIRYGWGEVVDNHLISSSFPDGIVRCRFDSFPYICYTYDGRFKQDGIKFLSFTEYTLSGFSQERPDLTKELKELIDLLTKGLNDAKELTNKLQNK